MSTRFRALALLISVALLSSCLREGSFYAENIQEFATVVEEQLVTDSGNVLNITENQSDVTDWNQNGKRYLVTYDILNIKRDIRLRELQDVAICEPVEQTTEQPAVQDPFELGASNLGGGYLNLLLGVFKAKDSTTPHTFTCQYRDEPDQGQMYLTLFCDGNNEHPASLPADKWETERTYCSIWLYPLLKDNARIILLIHNRVQKDDDGNWTVVADTLSMSGSAPVGF